MTLGIIGLIFACTVFACVVWWLIRQELNRAEDIAALTPTLKQHLMQRELEAIAQRSNVIVDRKEL